MGGSGQKRVDKGRWKRVENRWQMRADRRWRMMEDQMIDILIANTYHCFLIYTPINSLHPDPPFSPSLLLGIFIFTASTPP